LAAVLDDQIDTSDIPPLPETFWQNAVRNPFYRPVKQRVTVRMDADVLPGCARPDGDTNRGSTTSCVRRWCALLRSADDAEECSRICV
jgi:hypothetical protein